MLKLGSVPFLNAKPLIYPIENDLINHSFGLYYYEPSLLSLKLINGEVDIGLIPVGELVRHENYYIIPDICISSFGQVKSVVLKSRCKLEDITTVSVDERSQSSSALLRIILEEFYGLNPQYIKRDINKKFFEEVDAGMLIGNAGLKAFYNNDDDYKCFDLGELWTDFTGMPFVYAVFATKNKMNIHDDIVKLHESKRMGLANIPAIVESEYFALGLNSEQCNNYLTEGIRYDLGENEIKGLIKYSEFLHKLDFIEKLYEPKIYEIQKELI